MENMPIRKYLDKWPELYEGVKIISNLGANVAPWNIGQYKLTLDKNRYLVDGIPIIFYHFARLRKIYSWLYKANTNRYLIPYNFLLYQKLYKEYVLHVQQYSFPQTHAYPIRFSFLRLIRNLCFPDYIFLLPKDQINE